MSSRYSLCMMADNRALPSPPLTNAGAVLYHSIPASCQQVLYCTDTCSGSDNRPTISNTSTLRSLPDLLLPPARNELLHGEWWHGTRPLSSIQHAGMNCSNQQDCWKGCQNQIFLLPQLPNILSLAFCLQKLILNTGIVVTPVTQLNIRNWYMLIVAHLHMIQYRSSIGLKRVPPVGVLLHVDVVVPLGST